MTTILKNTVHIKYKQLTKEDRFELQKCLERGLNLTECGKYLHCSTSTIKKEIDRSKELRINSRYKNTCGLKFDKKSLISNTPSIKIAFVPSLYNFIISVIDRHKCIFISYFLHKTSVLYNNKFELLNTTHSLIIIVHIHYLLYNRFV